MAVGKRNVKCISTVLAFALVGCTTGHCRKSVDLPAPPPEEKVEEKPSVQDDAHIFVFKPDGSRQCEAGSGISVDTMKSQLKGIKVFSAKKQKDGLMHISVCGSPTGMANVFEITAKDMPLAEKKNFKKWLY